MQTVAAIILRPHLGWDFRVAQRGIEIGYAVESAALPDPGIERDPVLLARRVPGIGHEGFVAERGQRCTDDLDAGALRALRHLLEPGNHLLAGDLLFGFSPAV